jgi:autotransporter-associated beta strand protein
VLSGANTFVGTATISGGTLQIGAGGTTGTLGTGTAAVIDNATLAFNRSDSLTVANPISGSGVLNQIGSGTTILTGNNTYSGGTTISAGTLQVGNGGTSGSVGTGAVTNDGALVFNRSDALSVAAISGTGTVTQAGTGTTTLTGTNTYTGATNVNAGALLVNGSLASGSAVTVTGNGTVLGGSGTIGGAVTIGNNLDAPVLRGGTGATATGSLTVGNLTMNSGSIVQLALGPGGGTAHSTLALTGTYSFQSSQTFQFINLGATISTYQDIITGVTTDPGTTGTWQFDQNFNLGFAGFFSYDSVNNSIDLTLTAVPEPGTWAAATLALIGLLAHQRKRLKKILDRS